MTLGKVHSCEVIGCCVRVHAVRVRLQDFFGAPLSTTCNGDESVARVCVLQCAMLSPALRVRQFEIHGANRFPIEVWWAPVSEPFAAGSCHFEDHATLFDA
eukprot:726397_1